jgi:N-acetylglucosamine-6-phosphate deacetylase
VTDESRVEEWQSARLVTIAPEHPLARTVIPMLSSAGVVVSIGHTAASREAYDMAVNTGARHATHLFNAMSGMDHVHGGIAAYVLTDDRVTFSVIADLVHVHPSAIKVAWHAAGDRMIIVSDQVALENVANESTTARLVGAHVGVDTAVKNLVEACGVPLAEALVMVSERPARVLRLTDRGVLRTGLRADLVLLTEDLSVHSVVCEGFPTHVAAN